MVELMVHTTITRAEKYRDIVNFTLPTHFQSHYSEGNVPAGAGGPGSWGEEEGGAETGGREEKAGSGLPFGQPK